MRIEFSARGHKRTDGTFEIVGGIDLDVEEIATLLLDVERRKAELDRASSHDRRKEDESWL